MYECAFKGGDILCHHEIRDAAPAWQALAAHYEQTGISLRTLFEPIHSAARRWRSRADCTRLFQNGSPRRQIRGVRGWPMNGSAGANRRNVSGETINITESVRCCISRCARRAISRSVDGQDVARCTPGLDKMPASERVRGGLAANGKRIATFNMHGGSELGPVMARGPST